MAYNDDYGQSSNVHATGGVIAIGRRKYAVGLYWQPSPSGRVSQAAREAARQPGHMADFYAIRPGSKAGRVAQFGLAQKEFGHRLGQPTGAACLAEEQPGSWIGCFQVPEGWWLVVCRDDLIAPDGDVLYTDEATARNRMIEEISLGGLQRIYAPEPWGIPNSDPLPVSLLMQGRADFRLAAVRIPVAAYAGAAAGIVAVIAITYFGLTFQSRREVSPQDVLQATKQIQSGQVPDSTVLAPPPPPPPPPKEWQDQPLPEVWLAACRDTLTQVPVAVMGWRLGEVTCSGKSLSVSWKRTDGPAMMPPHAGESVPPKSDAVSTYDLPAFVARGEEPLSTPSANNLRALGQDWKAEISAIPDPPPPPGTPAGQEAPKAPWVKRKIIITSQTAPWTDWSQYQGLAGFVLNSTSWSGKNWRTEGVLYEKR